MSLLDSPDLIEIKLYYKYSNKTSKRKILVILEDKKAEELLKDEEKSKDIEVLETGWSLLTWKEQNEVMDLASRTTNAATGEKQFNFLSYRDAIIKRCLKTWNITMNEKPVPISSEAIDKLPGPVVINLYQKYENIIEYNEEELGN